VTTPDALAAFDPDAPIADPAVRVVGEADSKAMVGATVDLLNGTTGVVTSWVRLPVTDMIHLTIRESGKTFNTAFTLYPHDTFRLIAEAPKPDVVGIDPELARELARVQDAIRAREGEVADLKAREKQLSTLLLPQFQRSGSRTTEIDGRSVYIHAATYPKYLEKAPGEKYTAADAVAALRAIGRAHQIQPETVNYQTLGAILREYRDRDEDLPAVLAGIVELGENPSVRVGAPKVRRRK
jgi:hypothetical protein